MKYIKRCYICGRMVYPWQDTVKSEKVGTIHTSCLMVFYRKGYSKSFPVIYSDRSEESDRGDGQKMNKEEDIHNLKLYVWTHFDWCDDGIAFAIAETEKEARELILEERGYTVTSWGDLTVRSIVKYGYSIDIEPGL